MSHSARTPSRSVQTSGRIIGRFDVTRVIAWGQPELGDSCFTAVNTIIYVWKGIAPTFNLFLVICNANADCAQPDMIAIDLQDHFLARVTGPSAFVGYNEDLSAGLCLTFWDQVFADRFEMSMRGIFLEAAAQRGEIPFCALVAYLLNPPSMGIERAGDM